MPTRFDSHGIAPDGTDLGAHHSPDLSVVWSRLKALAEAADLPSRACERLAKAERLTAQWLATIAFFATVTAGVEALAVPTQLEAAVLDQLIPALYLERVAARSTRCITFTSATPTARRPTSTSSGEHTPPLFERLLCSATERWRWRRHHCPICRTARRKRVLAVLRCTTQHPFRERPQ